MPNLIFVFLIGISCCSNVLLAASNDRTTCEIKFLDLALDIKQYEAKLYAANNAGRREQRSPRTSEEAISAMIAQVGKDSRRVSSNRHVKRLVKEYATIKVQRWRLECGRYADEIRSKY